MARKKIRSNKQQLLGRLRRIEGQTAAIVRMVQDDAYCIDVLTQIAAARAALLAAGKVVLKDHLRSCVVESFARGRSERAIGEIETVLGQFVK
jgi:DNA-binding FrmR family transcriptional regulator